MVVVALCIKCDLENISKLEFPAESRFCFDVIDPSTSMERNGIFISPDETHEIPGSRGEANLILKFEGSNKHATMSFVAAKTKPVYTAEDSGKWVRMVTFECRGIEPVKWIPTADDPLTAYGTTDTPFQNVVDLSEGEWCDFDDRENTSVGVYNLEHKFEVVK